MAAGSTYRGEQDYTREAPTYDQGYDRRRPNFRKMGVNATIDVDPSLAAARFDNDTEACVYFCCPQAIQNVLRHAGNAACVVRLAADRARLTFEIADDGPGFDPATTARGMGLDIMQDRVDALEGTLDVRSAPGGGRTIAISIPLSVGASA